MSKKLTTEEFIARAKQVHGDKYDYSKTEYIDSKTKVCIICPIHGEFKQLPFNHLKGKGCNKCAIEKFVKKRTKSTEHFIEEAKKVHGDKYDYSKVEYVNNHTVVYIICPIHGEFPQLPTAHLHGNGCKKCATDLFAKKHTIKFEQFVDEAKKIHGDKYTYHKEKYINISTNTTITCPIHGEFKQLPTNHLKGYGCPDCGIEKMSKTKSKTFEQFVDEAKAVHGDKYIYHKESYINAHTPTIITCPIHGDFPQTPLAHIRQQGCPQCNQSHLENEIMQFLKENNIEFIPQHGFEWLKYKGKLSLDFYLPKYNIAIECQGRQHFSSFDFFGGEEGFEIIVKRDNIKRALCDSNGVKLLYYSNLGIVYPYHVYEDKQLLLEEIKKVGEKQ